MIGLFWLIAYCIIAHFFSILTLSYCAFHFHRQNKNDDHPILLNLYLYKQHQHASHHDVLLSFHSSSCSCGKCKHSIRRSSDSGSGYLQRALFKDLTKCSTTRVQCWRRKCLHQLCQRLQQQAVGKSLDRILRLPSDFIGAAISPFLTWATAP